MKKIKAIDVKIRESITGFRETAFGFSTDSDGIGTDYPTKLYSVIAPTRTLQNPSNTVARIASAVLKYKFNRLYTSFEGRTVMEKAMESVRLSADRYVAHLS